jgi:probable rRNA maturation factor
MTDPDGSAPAVTVDVQVACDAGRVPADSVISSWVRSAVAEIGVDSPVEVAVRIVDEAEGRALNRSYRGIDKATNVLSFPADDGDLPWPPGVERSLGDIVICEPIVESEAREQGKQSASHWAHLVVHGTLHLLGYDHDEDAAAEQMEAIETRILAAGGVADPYAA